MQDFRHCHPQVQKVHTPQVPDWEALFLILLTARSIYTLFIKENSEDFRCDFWRALSSMPKVNSQQNLIFLGQCRNAREWKIQSQLWTRSWASLYRSWGRGGSKQEWYLTRERYMYIVPIWSGYLWAKLGFPPRHKRFHGFFCWSGSQLENTKKVEPGMELGIELPKHRIGYFHIFSQT